MSNAAISEQFSFPLALADREGRLVYANLAWREFFDHQAGAPIYGDWNVSAMVDSVNYWHQIVKDLEAGRTKPLQVESQKKRFHFFFSEGREEVRGLLWVRFECVGAAIPESENLAQDERMAAMAEMAAGIAHEILNPLTIIAGKTSILQNMLPDAEDQKTKDMHKCMDSITNQCNRITKIVRALRTFSRAGSQDALLPVPLKQLIDESIALCSEKSRLRGTRFRVESPPADTVVYCRAVQVVQILINLITNAIDATQDVDFPEVQIRFREVHGAIEILVSDNGPGVPEDLAQKIFQPFYTTKDVGKGTGLGLSLSLRLSRDNGGDLFLDRNLGPSCFGLQLKTSNPMKPAA